jgi:hypothetical protein
MSNKFLTFVARQGGVSHRPYLRIDAGAWVADGVLVEPDQRFIFDVPRIQWGYERWDQRKLMETIKAELDQSLPNYDEKRYTLNYFVPVIAEQKLTEYLFKAGNKSAHEGIKRIIEAYGKRLRPASQLPVCTLGVVPYETEKGVGYRPVFNVEGWVEMPGDDGDSRADGHVEEHADLGPRLTLEESVALDPPAELRDQWAVEDLEFDQRHEPAPQF